MINNLNTMQELIKIPDDEDVKVFLNNSQGDYNSNHWHNALEIIYIISGELDVSIRNKLFKITCNDFILINSKTVHSTKCITENCALVIQIPYEYMKKYLSDIDMIIFNLPFNSNNEQDNFDILKLQNILKNMYITIKKNSNDSKLKFNLLLFELLYELYSNFKISIPKNNYIKQSKNFSSLEPVLAYIQENYSSPISIEEISKIAGFQSKYFCRFFKKNMGLTFLEYLCELRLSYIYRDLTTTNIPLYELLEIHGFTNYKLFRRTFKNRFNCTPSDIRRLNKTNQSKLE